MASDTPWNITNKDFSHYFAFYHEIVPDGELLSGSRAREFFLLSNLSPVTLSHIWKLADIDEDGQLNPAEFAVALHLTQLALDGSLPPTSLPSSLRSLILKVLAPQEYIPTAKINQIEKCQSAFLSFCENVSNTGYLSAEASRYLLTNSQLSRAQLFHIWKLADIDKDGRLSFDQFVIAMHLIFIAKLDNPLPLHINGVDIFPNEFYPIAKKVSAIVAEKPPVDPKTPPPLIPTFVIPTENSVINPIFKTIPPEKFCDGKFDVFTGDPFQNHLAMQNMNGSNNRLDSSHEELSVTTSSLHSSQLSHSESADISKLSSSRHSSVKSLVEERDEPTLQQAESIDIEISEPLGATPTEEKDLTSDTDQDVEATKEELEKISKASQDFLSRTGGPSPQTREPYKDPYANAPEMKTASAKGLNAIINDISPEPPVSPTPKETIAKTKSETHTTENGTESANDFLAQLDDLEAQIMDVLDDASTFDPMAETTPPKPPPPMPVSKPPPMPVVKPKKIIQNDETDSVFQDTKQKSKTLPQTRSNSSSREPSPRLPTGGDRKNSARSSSDSSTEPSPSPRRFTVGGSPARKKIVSQNRNSALLDDLDDLFSAELASIDNLLDAQQSKEKKAEERQMKETEELKVMEKKAMETPELPRMQVTSMEEIRRKRQQESQQKQQQWEEELKAIEQQARHQYEEEMKKVQLLEDETIHTLESEWNQLLEQEREHMKEAWVIRAQREKEEEERREKMRQQMSERREVTIEEWIQMMEENKIEKMTPEEKEKYEKRKKAWLEHRRQKEEKQRQEMEEKLRKNRERMAEEYLRVRTMEEEVKQSRLDTETLKELGEEQIKKEAVERKFRTEQAQKRKEEAKQREIEENKSKARSALAARWEQQVKQRNTKDYKSTVLSGSDNKDSTRLREEERLAKRVGKLN